VPLGTNVAAAKVAVFSAPGGSTKLADYSATVDWGDGTSSAGTIASAASGFVVTASHNYGSPGNRLLKITVVGPGGATGEGVTTATVGSPNQRWVAQVYRDLLHREVEPQGLAAWSGLLDAGHSRTEVALDIAESLEYRVDVVQGLYRLFLHRAAEPAIAAADSNFLAVGGTPEQLATNLVSSTEYFQVRSAATNAGFLHALYNDDFNRDVDAAALRAAGGFDFAKAANRALVAQTIFGSDEYLHDLVNFPGGISNPFHDQLPKGFYQSFLARDGDQQGVNFDVALLRHGTPDAVVVADMLASDEYFARSGQQPG
jgi:hypothetical protein